MSDVLPSLVAGFSNPPLQAQAVFRLVLDAMARPGRIQELSGDLPSAPKPLNDASFAVALTLLDFETLVWLDKKLATPPVVDGLKFHCGCSIAERVDGAAYAIIGDPATMPPFSDFNLGTPEYPDRAATLVLQIDGLAGGDGLALSGPGIKDQARLTVSGLPDHFEQQWRANHLSFPNGVDVILTSGRTLACLPRTTSLGA